MGIEQREESGLESTLLTLTAGLSILEALLTSGLTVEAVRSLITRVGRARRNGWPFPPGSLEPELLHEIRGLQQRPDVAALIAARYLEIVIRAMGGYSEADYGQALINRAMGPGQPLEPRAPTTTESRGWVNIFLGVYAVFRNPEAHRDQHLTPEEAIGWIMIMNKLLRKLKQDYPDLFRQAVS